MKHGNFANPDEYVAAWSGRQFGCVRMPRDTVLAAAHFDEAIKWGHLAYAHNGPVLQIRGVDDGVRLGFWRGQRLIDIEPRLVPGGKYEMATGLALADSIILATARAEDAVLWTQEAHFEGLEKVEFRRKRAVGG